MILRFTADASTEERARVEGLLADFGARPVPREGALYFRAALVAEELTALAALPGVDGVSAAGQTYSTVRIAALGWISAACAVIGLLAVLAANFPASLGTPADPLRTPEGLQPTWALLPAHGVLEGAPDWFPASVLPIIALILLVFWPWIGGRLAARSPRAHTAVAAVALVVVGVMAWLGVSR